MVRLAIESDLAAINDIENWAIANTFAHFGVEPMPHQETQSAFAEKSDRYPWFVKVVDDHVVAFARASPWKSRAAYQWTTEVGIYVHPDCQGQGIGAELYADLFAELTKHEFHTVLAGITLPNDASVRLHEKFGMVRCATFPENGFKFGEWRDVGYWVRRLSP